jgi:hypothetical protein
MPVGCLAKKRQPFCVKKAGVNLREIAIKMAMNIVQH